MAVQYRNIFVITIEIYLNSDITKFDIKNKKLIIKLDITLYISKVSRLSPFIRTSIIKLNYELCVLYFLLKNMLR